MKYQTNPEFRAKKRANQVKWRRAFFEKNGFWASALYEQKPPESRRTA